MNRPTKHNDYEPHITSECFAIIFWSRSLLKTNYRHFDHVDEICEQLWAERRIMRIPEYKLLGDKL